MEKLKRLIQVLQTRSELIDTDWGVVHSVYRINEV